MTDWTQRRGPLVALCAIVLACAGCATEEELKFGDPARVTGGFPVSASAGGGEICEVDDSCQISWALQIYGDILDGPAACGAKDCHAEGTDPSGGE